MTQPGQSRAPNRRRGALTRHSDLFEPDGDAAVVQVVQVVQVAQVVQLGRPAQSGAQPGRTDTEA
ncbi:hypothetical protein [Streptomyces violarus]|uniref:hypothetical protein n=1 Tax=Streptomyces violarus TaxID=67380 RepID=UPI0021BE97E5|nr:hypothetical protein [Streptomyces violarus]MCT9142351.1 hypothetical protein [Streptomyces violarus]